MLECVMDDWLSSGYPASGDFIAAFSFQDHLSLATILKDYGYIHSSSCSGYDEICFCTVAFALIEAFYLIFWRVLYALENYECLRDLEYLRLSARLSILL